MLARMSSSVTLSYIVVAGLLEGPWLIATDLVFISVVLNRKDCGHRDKCTAWCKGPRSALLYVDKAAK